LATQKLDKAVTAADDSDRMRKVLESRANGDEERMSKLEEELKDEDVEEGGDKTFKPFAELQISQNHYFVTAIYFESKTFLITRIIINN
jgi:hypothetical protein